MAVICAVLEAALATITVPAGTTGTPVGMAALAGALGWSLDRPGTAVAALDVGAVNVDIPGRGASPGVT